MGWFIDIDHEIHGSPLGDADAVAQLARPYQPAIMATTKIVAMVANTPAATLWLNRGSGPRRYHAAKATAIATRKPIRRML